MGDKWCDLPEELRNRLREGRARNRANERAINKAKVAACKPRYPWMVSKSVARLPYFTGLRLDKCMLITHQLNCLRNESTEYRLSKRSILTRLVDGEYRRLKAEFAQEMTLRPREREYLKRFFDDVCNLD